MGTLPIRCSALHGLHPSSRPAGRNAVYYWVLAGMLVLTARPARADVTHEMFSSMSSLRSLLRGEGTLIESVKSYLAAEERRLSDIRTFLIDRKISVNAYTRDAEGTTRSLDNPVTSYSLIRDWSYIVDKMQDQTAFDRAVSDAESRNANFPSSMDRLGALRALLRLQRVYNISVNDMAAGKVRAHEAPLPLTTRDFYDLGTTAYFIGQGQYAVSWLQKVLDSHNFSGQDAHLIPKQEVLHQMALAHYENGDLEDAVLTASEALDLDKRNDSVAQTLRKFKRANETRHGDRGRPIQLPPLWRTQYEVLCRSNPNIATDEMAVTSTGWCQYRTSGTPYAPFKFEVLNRDPWVSLVYEAISERDAAALREKAGPQLYRAVVGDPAKSFVTEDRVSKVAWLWDGDRRDSIRRLSRRVEAITGLSTTYRPVFASSEPFQVVNYGMGGQYEPHVDVYENKQHLSNVPYFLKGTGDRIATFMFYLSDVAEGGATVFPLLNIYVPPIKNAAAFWFNIHRNGELDLRTQHAGCPVLVGEKWVANKWIREYGQEFRRPCGISMVATETDDFINGRRLRRGP